MASDNDTVVEVCKELSSGCERGLSIECQWLEDDIVDFANRIRAAHRREVAELNAIINAECRKCCECAKFGKDCNAGDVDGAEDNRACEKFVSKEVAELRECLRIIRDNLVLHTIKSADGKYVNNGAFLSEEFVDDERWRKALEGGAK